MKTAVIVGSGAGGATAAKELQGHYNVTVLEAGEDFKPFSADLSLLAKIRRTGLFFDERLIKLLFPAMRVQKTPDRLVMVSGTGCGGTTTLSTGNAVRADKSLQALGINLDPEFEELYREIPVTTDHQQRWRRITRLLYDICQDLGLNPEPAPKMGDYSRCAVCGRCILGCERQVKWDSRIFLDIAVQKGARLITGCRAQQVAIKDGRAVGVRAIQNRSTSFYPADLIILAAGGLGTPIILQNSGIACEDRLFVDPVLSVAAKWEGARQNLEIPMPFIMQQDHFILSPYFDPLNFFFNRAWNHQAENIAGMMIKLADENRGSVSAAGIDKTLSDIDHERLRQAVEICRDILGRLGVKKEEIFLGTINAGHPGGMLPLTREEKDTLHNPRLPANLYVADATLFPESLGNPPIFTIMAMAKRISRLCIAEA